MIEFLTPAVEEFPPDQFEPLLEVHFSPLAMAPPLRAKLVFIEGRRNAVGRRRNPAKNAERPAGVVIGRDQQNALTVYTLKATGDIFGFVPGRLPVNGTNGYRASLWQTLDILSREVRLVPLVNLCLGWNIEN